MGNVYYCFFPGPQGLTREWLQGKRLPVAGSDTVVGRRITALVGGHLGSENREEESWTPQGPQSWAKSAWAVQRRKVFNQR